MRYLLSSLLLVFVVTSFAQQKDSIAEEINKSLVQLSGVVVNSDSLEYLPFVAVFEEGKKRGTFSDQYGFFSLVVRKGDTIHFAMIGMKEATFVVPDTLSGYEYSLIQTLDYSADTLQTVEITPYPSQQELYNYLLAMNAPSDEISAAAANMSPAQMANLMANLPVGGSVTYKHSLNDRVSQMYWQGQAPPNNLLNPIAWAQFIDAWSKGKFKQQKK